MRSFFILLFFINYSTLVGKESLKNSENLCVVAINENTDYQVLGIYGSPHESEWHPAAAFVLLKEMYRFKVVRKEFQQKSPPWQFEFVEMYGGKTIAFVFNLDTRINYCAGPNSFFVKKK